MPAQGTGRLTQRPQTTSQFQYFTVDEVAALIAVSHTSRRCWAGRPNVLGRMPECSGHMDVQELP